MFGCRQREGDGELGGSDGCVAACDGWRELASDNEEAHELGLRLFRFDKNRPADRDEQQEGEGQIQFFSRVVGIRTELENDLRASSRKDRGA